MTESVRGWLRIKLLLLLLHHVAVFQEIPFVSRSWAVEGDGWGKA